MVTTYRVPGRYPDAEPQPELRQVRTVDSPNCTGACGWLATVKDDTIIDLKPAADYPEAEYNPRGCLRGMSSTALIYHPDRLRTPLIREGKRGEGLWREASWDETLDILAEKFKQISADYGPESILFFNQVVGTSNMQKGAQVRLATLMGASYATAYDYNGDISMGYTHTVGIDSLESESAAWQYAKTIILWGSNVFQTRMPDAKFILRAQENGAKIILIDPRASQTAKAADLWLPIAPGTDGLLALGMARLIMDNNWLNESFMRTFTDLPLLVREDTGERLRASDIGIGSANEFVAVYPAADSSQANRFVCVSRETLDVKGEKDLALEGEYSVEINGQTITVRPAFTLLKEKLQSDEYTLENVSRQTGVDADIIYEITELYANQRPAQIIIGMGLNHRLHGDLSIRSVLLLGGLTGGFGTPGQSIDIYSGQHHVRFDISAWWYPEGKRPNVFPMHYLLLPEKRESMNEKIKLPKNGVKALFFSHANIFTTGHVNEWRRLRDEIDLIVAVDYLKTPSTELADIVLPAPTFWEKYELVVTGPHPYVQIQQPVISPRFEAKTEFWMMKELAKRLNPEWESYFSMSEEETIDYILQNGGHFAEGITLEALKKGPVRLANLPNPDVPLYENIHERIPFPPHAYPHREGAQKPFLPTGRIEFYKEEKTFHELGETLPTYKNAYTHLSKEERRYPLAFVTPHSKWRVHSTHASNPWLRNLNRKPVVEINPQDASARHIKDGDLVEVFNAYGSFQLWARVTQTIRPGTLSVDHGWWAQYLAKGEYNNILLPERIKSTHENHFLPAVYAPGQLWKDPRVDIRRA